MTYEEYACSGRRRRLPFWPKGMTPTGERPSWLPDRCPQKPIKREVIDTPAWTFFERVGLDLDATRASVSQAHDARLEEARALRHQAEREAARARDRMARVRRDYQDGKLDADDWREQRDQLTAEEEAATAEATRHAERERDLEAEAQALNAEDVILAELATMRALVAGQVQERSRESLDAVRAALTRLFEKFELVTHPLVIDDSEELPLYTHPALSLPQDPEHPGVAADGRPWQWLRPFLRPEAVEGWDAEERFPALRRAAVTFNESVCSGDRRLRGRSCAPCRPRPIGR